MRIVKDCYDIKIERDLTFDLCSTDNRRYDYIFNPQNLSSVDHPKAFAISINDGARQLKIALVGGYCCFEEDCAVINGNFLTVLQTDVLTTINLLKPEVTQTKKIDLESWGLGLYRWQNGYVIYSETEILKLDNNYNEEWRFCGKDIFISISGKRAFKLCENKIKLYDFLDNYYELDVKGNLIN